MNCTLYQYVPGTLVENNKKGIVDLPFFIGEAPGEEEVVHNAPFIGKSGTLLRKLLKDFPSYYLTNIVKCRPPNNRDPLSEEIKLCRKHLNEELNNLEPKYVICVGRVAARSLDQPLGAHSGVLTRMDHVLDYAPPHGLLIGHILHPAATLYNPNLISTLIEEVERLKETILQ